MTAWKSFFMCFDSEINTTIYSKELFALG